MIVEMIQKKRSNRWHVLISELEERFFQNVQFDMEDMSFVYFLAKEENEVIEIEVCFENCNIYKRKLGFEDWWYVGYSETFLS